MSGELHACTRCSAPIFYADEKVIGTWNGEPNTRFDVLDFDQYEKGVPEGYLVFCLDCAPCECEFHPPLMSDKEARDNGWCFNPECLISALTREDEANWHRHYNDIPRDSVSECLCRDVDYAPCGVCDPDEGVDTGENPEGCSAPVCMACGYTTNQIY